MNKSIIESLKTLMTKRQEYYLVLHPKVKEQVEKQWLEAFGCKPPFKIYSDSHIHDET